MARPSEQQEALAGLLGLGSHSARKSHYPELLARLEELEAERNRYKWLFEHAVHGIFQASLGQGLRAANPALAQMLGYDDPQQVLWSLEDMAGQLFVGGEAEMRRIRALLRERGGLFGYETRLWRRDGSHIEVLMNLLLRHDEEELVEGFVADITERVQAQQRLQTMNEELERRVAERTHELEELNRQLRQALFVHQQYRLERAAFEVLVEVVAGVQAGVCLAHATWLQGRGLDVERADFRALAIGQAQAADREGVGEGAWPNIDVQATVECR